MKTVKLPLLALSAFIFASDGHCSTAKRPLPANISALNTVYATGSNNMMASKNLTVSDCNGFLLGAVEKLDLLMVQTVLFPPKTKQALGKAPQDNLKPDQAGIEAALSALVVKTNITQPNVDAMKEIHKLLVSASPAPGETVMGDTLIKIANRSVEQSHEKNLVSAMISAHFGYGKTRPVQTKVDQVFTIALKKELTGTVQTLLNINNYNPTGMKLSQYRIDEILFNEVASQNIENVGLLINKSNGVKPNQTGMNNAFFTACGLEKTLGQSTLQPATAHSKNAPFNNDMISKLITNEELRPDQATLCSVIMHFLENDNIDAVVDIIKIDSTLFVDKSTSDLVIIKLINKRDELPKDKSDATTKNIQRIDAAVLKIIKLVSKNKANEVLDWSVRTEQVTLISALSGLTNNRPDDTAFNNALLKSVDLSKKIVVAHIMDNEKIAIDQTTANEAFKKAFEISRKVSTKGSSTDAIIEKIIANAKRNPVQANIDAALLSPETPQYSHKPAVVSVILKNTTRVGPSVSAVSSALIESAKQSSPETFNELLVNNRSLIQPDKNSVDQALFAIVERKDAVFNDRIQSQILNVSKASEAGVNSALLKAIELGKTDIVEIILKNSGLLPDQATINDALLKVIDAENLKMMALLLPAEASAADFKAVRPDQATRNKAFATTFEKENEGNEAILKNLKIDQAGFNALFLTYVNATKADSRTTNTRKIEKLLSGNFDVMIDQVTLDRALTKKDDTSESNVLLHKETLETLLATHVSVKPSPNAINTLFAEAALQAKPQIVTFLLTSNKPSDETLIDVLKQVAQKLATKLEKETYAAYKDVFKRIIAATTSIDQTSYNTLFESCALKSKELMEIMLNGRQKPSVPSVTIVLQELLNARGDKAFEDKFGAGIEEKVTLLLAGDLKPNATEIKTALEAMDTRFKGKQTSLKADKGVIQDTIKNAEAKYKVFKDIPISDDFSQKVFNI